MAKVVRMPHHEAMENELCGDVAELDDGRPPTTMKIVQSSIPDHDSGKSSYKTCRSDRTPAVGDSASSSPAAPPPLPSPFRKASANGEKSRSKRSNMETANFDHPPTVPELSIASSRVGCSSHRHSAQVPPRPVEEGESTVNNNNPERSRRRRQPGGEQPTSLELQSLGIGAASPLSLSHVSLRQKRSRSWDFSRILSTKSPPPSGQVMTSGRRAWACDQQGICEAGAPPFPSCFTIERMESFLSVAGNKFITAELHTASVERMKGSGSDDSTPDVGETGWPFVPDSETASQFKPTKSGAPRDRERKRLQKDGEVFRLFLHIGRYSVPLLPNNVDASAAGLVSTQRPRAYTSAGDGPGCCSTTAVFDDHRQCYFFSKRQSAKKFFAKLERKLTPRAGYKKVFIPPSPMMGSAETQHQLSRGGELFKLVERCSLPNSIISPKCQSKIAKEILHVLKNCAPASPLSKTIQSKSVVRYLLKNAFFNTFPWSLSAQPSSLSPPVLLSTSLPSTPRDTSSLSLPPEATAMAEPAVSSESLPKTLRLNRIVSESSSASLSPSIQTWRSRDASSPSPSLPPSLSFQLPPPTRPEGQERLRDHQQQPHREKRERSLIKRWRKTVLRIIDITRENNEKGYYADVPEFNNTHFIKELTRSEFSPYYIHCLLAPFLSADPRNAAFGFERLSSVEFVLQLIRLNNPLVDQFVTFDYSEKNTNLLYFCLDSLFKFPRNNILHSLIHNIIASIFERNESQGACQQQDAMDIELSGQPGDDEEANQSMYEALHDQMVHQWSSEAMKLKRVVLTDCLLLSQLVTYFHSLRAERERRQASAESNNSHSTSVFLVEEGYADITTADEGEASARESSEKPPPAVDTSDEEEEKPKSDSSSSFILSSFNTTRPITRVITGGQWEGEENLGPVVKIANRILSGPSNQHLGCSLRLLTRVLGLDEALAQAWLDIVHTDLREINALENSQPFEKPYVSFSSPLKNSLESFLVMNRNCSS